MHAHGYTAATVRIKPIQMRRARGYYATGSWRQKLGPRARGPETWAAGTRSAIVPFL